MVAEPIGPHCLRSDFSRMNVDEKGKALGTTTHYKAGEWITPTQAELDAFGDRFEAATEAHVPPPTEPPPEETTSARPRR